MSIFSANVSTMNFLNKGKRFFQKLQMIDCSFIRCLKFSHQSNFQTDFSSERPLVNELLTVIPTAFIYEEDCSY